VKTLIAIMTCQRPEYFGKALAQWFTWVPDVSHYPEVDVVFFTGRRAAFVNTVFETVALDAPDDYRGIPLKVLAMLKWSAARDYGRTIKLDDDVYVVPSRFPNLLTSLDYVGRFRGPHGGYPAYFASGFAYTLSRRAVEIVASTPWNQDWMDERFVANALAARGIFGFSDEANYRVSGPHTLPHVIPHSQHAKGTVFCEYFPKELYELHRIMKNAPPTNFADAKPMPPVIISPEQLAAPPRDNPPIGKVYRQ
jgi:hypothetical protein